VPFGPGLRAAKERLAIVDASASVRQMVKFTLSQDNPYRRLRHGQLEAPADLINLTLGAGDQIKNMLDAADGRATVDQGRSANLLAELRKLTGSANARPDIASIASPAPYVTPGGLALASPFLIGRRAQNPMLCEYGTTRSRLWRLSRRRELLPASRHAAWYAVGSCKHSADGCLT
jgi:hypothetical protein